MPHFFIVITPVLTFIYCFALIDSITPTPVSESSHRIITVIKSCRAAPYRLTKATVVERRELTSNHQVQYCTHWYF